MFLQLLSNSPILALMWLAAILISLTVHEFAHALIGSKLGDPTAEQMGRLTLNPVAHIDLFGFIPLLLFGFGWAKPVPFNSYNLHDPKWDSVKIALGGPLANIILALLSAIAIRVLSTTGILSILGELSFFLSLLVVINLMLLLFNLLPVHPLDGSKLLDALLLHTKYELIRQMIATYGPRILLFLVLISVFADINVFGFITIPAYWICHLISGGLVC